MEQRKIYRVSLLTIGAFMLGSILFLLINLAALVEALKEGSIVEALTFTGMLFVLPLPFLGYSIYLWRKRKEGKGFYWDDEGVVVDLKGSKVYWDEIESIVFSENKTIALSKSTVIYPHYTHHEKIRIRRNKWMPTPAHSIDWFLIEKPKEYHENVMKVWEEKKHE
ncbi:hypothetical protein [Planococcus shixiaomingii]|uniref:hypothetical protein n=1 Tax=Planococcus shixiaomingii TaxID=3058393 RepID=UPI00260C25DF|nr:hypothetical protein [Planococcus sp. N022]WKA54488.1 hypothetical protein QWY21_17725 [Planococcus sp. N022]